MAQIIELTSLHDPAVAAYAQLTEAQLRSRLEPELGVFIAESPKVIVTALDAGLRPLSLLMERRHLTGQGAALLARCGDIPVYTGEREQRAPLPGHTPARGSPCGRARPPAELFLPLRLPESSKRSGSQFLTAKRIPGPPARPD